MYRNLLVPLDGSAFGEQALPMALSIARRTGAALQLTHVHVPPMPVGIEGLPIVDAPLENEMRQHERAYLDGVVKRVEAAGQVKVTTTLLEGPVAEAIHQQAVSGQADLVVLTTHGRGPLSRFWLGSVADQLVRKLPMPMLLVRPQEAAPDLSRDVGLRHVLIALDGSPFAEQVLPAATALGTAMKADQTLLCVVPPLMPGSYDLGDIPAMGLAGSRFAQLQRMHEEEIKQAESYLDRVAARLRQQGLKVQTRVVRQDSPGAAILEEARQLGVDVVALATHGRGGLGRILLGSVADKVLRGATMPVLIHRPVRA